MKAGKVVAAASALLYVLAPPSVESHSTEAASADIRQQARRLSQVRSWRMTFRYKMDVHFENDLGDLGGEEQHQVEAEGSVSFARSSRRFQYEGTGETTFDLDYYSLARLNEYRILDVETASGSASIVPHEDFNFLRFDFDTFTYSFVLVPGEEIAGDFGVPSRSYRQSNITEGVIAEMREAGAPVLYPEMLRAMMPDDQVWDEFVSTFSVAAHGIPLPFFGLKLAGSTTDAGGGVVTWSLEPADGTREEFLTPEEPQIEGFDESENWVHFHPQSAHDDPLLSSAWPTLAEGMSEAESEGGSSTAQPSPMADLSVFLVSSEDSPAAVPTGCGDNLVPVALEATAVSDDSTGGGRPFAHSEEIPAQLSSAPQDTLRLLMGRLVYGDAAGPGAALRNVVGEHGLYLEDAAVNGSAASVTLGGHFAERAACDRTRIEAQVRQTALQVSGISSVRILLSDERP